MALNALLVAYWFLRKVDATNSFRLSRYVRLVVDDCAKLECAHVVMQRTQEDEHVC